MSASSSEALSSDFKFNQANSSDSEEFNTIVHPDPGCPELIGRIESFTFSEVELNEFKNSHSNSSSIIFEVERISRSALWIGSEEPTSL